MKRILIWIGALAVGIPALILLCWIGIILILAWLGPSARGDDSLIEPTPEEYKAIQSWISPTCCWTNRCCFKVAASAISAIPSVPFKDEWRVEATGQILKRTGWSRDGQTWRCTCDPVGSTWVAHVKANTRCIFPVANGS